MCFLLGCGTSFPFVKQSLDIFVTEVRGREKTRKTLQLFIKLLLLTNRTCSVGGKLYEINRIPISVTVSPICELGKLNNSSENIYSNQIKQ